jgi:phosphoribosylaminoimidazolecarboxamide formyltransferase/IMP cyclohydrolase
LPIRAKPSRDAGHHRRARHRVALWREPHQKAALYLPKGPAAKGIANAVQVQGKELSYNNYNDADAALELVAEFRDAEPTVVIVKHANPCGVATAPTLVEAYEAALKCDSVSAFGGIIAVNRPLDGPTAEAISGIFTEVVCAPTPMTRPRRCLPRRRTCACC